MASPIPEYSFFVVFLMKPILSIFQPAIKFDCLLLAIFQSLFRFICFNFDKLAPFPLNKCFKISFKSFFKSIPVLKTASEELKA